MSQSLKLQLAIFTIFSLYFIIRLIGVSDISLSIWQQIYWGNAIRNTTLLFLGLPLGYLILNSIRFNPKTGPSIISSQKLKLALSLAIIFVWLAVVNHTIFDSFKLIFPLNQFSAYQFADLLDETIAHIFMFLPIIVFFFVTSILEIERPQPLPAKKLELTLSIFLSLIIGLAWGLNLTEGRLASITSLPLMLVFLAFMLYLVVNHHLSLRSRPWNLSSIITLTTGSITFSVYGAFFRSFPQFFSILN